MMTNEPDNRVKSRPLYLPITIKEKAAFHLFIQEEMSRNNGDQAAIESELVSLFKQCQSPAKNWMDLEKASISLFSNANFQQSDHLDRLEPSPLTQALSSLPIATQVYVSGTESFMWDVHNIFVSAGLLTEQISLMPPVSSERRVFCTHCYTIMEKITHTPVNCEGCQRPLLVRDHFSRFHGAYVGLNVNAEDTSDIPEKEALT